MYILIVSFIIPITLIILSIYLSYKAKSKISKYSGFRTKLSMKDEKSWYKAQKLASKYSFYGGIIAIILTLVFIKLGDMNEKNLLILTFIQVLILISVSLITQINLKRH